VSDVDVVDVEVSPPAPDVTPVPVDVSPVPEPVLVTESVVDPGPVTDPPPAPLPACLTSLMPQPEYQNAAKSAAAKTTRIERHRADRQLEKASIGRATPL
jgi:hypothetical protein